MWYSNAARRSPRMTLAVPLAEAALFTLGCAVIHAQRDRPERLTRTLAVLACLAFLAVVALATPGPNLRAGAVAEMGGVLPLSGEPAQDPP
ncbi:hypothetical protein M446_0585 [Methylobacterium sp. 4-46]|nr:hypothetical protein M446_0585 [Methylobacterium sp. 4-46]